MSKQLIIKMVRQATQDSSLMASLIEQQCLKNGRSWAEQAALMGTDEAHLARLALCYIPRKTAYKTDLYHIATYAEIPQDAIVQLLPSIRQLAKPKHNKRANWGLPSFMKNVQFMYKRSYLAMSIALVTLMVLGAFAVAQPQSALGSEATLVIESGTGTVTQLTSRLFSQPTETAVAAGDIFTVRQGDVVVLDAASSAQLRLQNGGTVDLYPNTVLEITTLYTQDDSYRVQLTQLAGRTINRVIRLVDVEDTYEIRTPSSTASVRGTIFTVDVLSEKASHIIVEEGLVEVTMGNDSVLVSAGNEVFAQVGNPLNVVPTAPSGPIVEGPDRTPSTASSRDNTPDRTNDDTESINKPVIDAVVNESSTTEANAPTTAFTPPNTNPPAVTADLPSGEIASNPCMGTSQYPQGVQLANEYGVPYDEIMGWFCSGYGFGEIKLVYDYSAENDVSVSELFDQKALGTGWGPVNGSATGDDKSNDNNSSNNSNNDNSDNSNNDNSNNGNNNNAGNSGNGNKKP